MTTPPMTLPVEASLEAITNLFEKRSISAAPVLSGDRLVGVVSTTDIVRHLAKKNDRAATAQTLMSGVPIVARPDDPLEEAARRLIAGRLHRLVVTEGERPIGIVSAHDMLDVVASSRLALPLRELMRTPVETVMVDDTIDTAMKRLAAANVHGLVVVDGLNPVGVFTHREAIAARGLPPSLRERPVEDVMSYETICLNLETPAYRAARYGRAMNVRRFLVVDRRSLVGIVSSFDLVGIIGFILPTDRAGTAAAQS